MRDWRLNENREEAFLRFYGFHLKYKSHPGCVYSLLPALAPDADDDQKAWIVWLNGNTQNPVTTSLLLEQAPRHTQWSKAVDFWNDNFKALEWDTDRRYQKGKFGEATEDWFFRYGHNPAEDWHLVGNQSWKATWKFALEQPHMGRLSAWSMIEYARILVGPQVPDSDTWMLKDTDGSRSHRNGIAVVKGYAGAENWDAAVPKTLGILEELNAYGDELLRKARERCPEEPDVGRLTMESALCTYKSWHKPNRRYPNVYADMTHGRLRRAEAVWGKRFEALWQARREDLPEELRMEDNPQDPGLVPVKQNWYRETGEIPMMYIDWPDMTSEFDRTYGRAS